MPAIEEISVGATAHGGTFSDPVDKEWNDDYGRPGVDFGPSK